MINKIIIHNYKIFRDFTLDLNDDLNIIVGDNEVGKSTILEATNLAATKKINGRFLENELSPYYFNVYATDDYIKSLQSTQTPVPPNIFIELYLRDLPELAELRGTNNSLRENRIGIRLDISFDDDFKAEYEELLKEKNQITLIPTEYYKINWKTFADKALTIRNVPIILSSIDATTIHLQSGTDYYLQNIIRNGLDSKERVALSIAYRKLKEDFSKQPYISEINKKLDDEKSEITEKDLTLEIDVSQRTNWETSLTPHLDHIPFLFIGKGEQNSLKIMLAMHKAKDSTNIILIEEPENHLSFSSLNNLLVRIKENSKGKQIIITTHNSFVLNKLGLDKLILLANGNSARFSSLDPETRDYFMKLSGYDTLRLILAKKAILVEGPSDELIVQKAYLLENKRLPIENGVDIINVRGLSFKRYLDLAKDLEINVNVVTDNDGDYKKNIEEKYSGYQKNENIKIFADEDNLASTLEPQIMKCNNLAVLNNIFQTDFTNPDGMINFMKNNKTTYALMLFNTDTEFSIPQYIKNAIK